MKHNFVQNTMFFVFALFICLFISCDEGNKYEGMTKVTYHLVGGSYQGSTLDFENYYEFTDDQKHLIYDPQELSGKSVSKESYSFDGWYLAEEKEGIVYKEKWNFQTDEVLSETLDLYAKWNKYTYLVCYYDDNNELVSVGSYFVDQGEKFKDLKNYTKRQGYTLVGYADENGNDLDVSTFSHPGDECEEVKIICKYIKGTFALVSTANELILNKGKNIYLTSDIDMTGKAAFSFDDFNKIIIGNNHTIKNLTIKYSASKANLLPDFSDENKNSLMISLFGNMKNAKIQDVTFENVNVDIVTTLSTTYKIYLSPFAMSLENVELSNVKLKGSYKISKIPSSMSLDDVIVVKDQMWYICDDKSIIENCILEFTELK